MNLFSDPCIELINLQPACIPCSFLECSPFLDYRKFVKLIMTKLTELLIVHIMNAVEFLQK